jgi:hypothetical protein
VRVIDTSASRPEEVAARLIDRIADERALTRSGAHPLAGRAAYDQSEE